MRLIGCGPNFVLSEVEPETEKNTGIEAGNSNSGEEGRGIGCDGGRGHGNGHATVPLDFGESPILQNHMGPRHSTKIGASRTLTVWL